MESVKDKVVLITGASSGIGASTAILFAKYGSRLALTGRNKKNLEEVGRQCEQQGLSKDKILLVTGELAKDGDIQRIVTSTLEKFGTIHVLVNNAGMTLLGNLQQMTMEDLDVIYKVNVRATCNLTKLVIPYLKKNQGSIVNVSSVGSFRPSTPMFAYCMAKAAIDMFSRNLALELGADNVRVNCVNPGEIKTAIVSRTGITGQKLDEYYEMTAKNHPLARVGEPIEVASAIVFLASDAASFMTGTVIPVDGGIGQTTSWTNVEDKYL